jgi:hypothetical protein
MLLPITITGRVVHGSVHGVVTSRGLGYKSKCRWRGARPAWLGILMHLLFANRAVLHLFIYLLPLLTGHNLASTIGYGGPSNSVTQAVVRVPVSQDRPRPPCNGKHGRDCPPHLCLINRSRARWNARVLRFSFSLPNSTSYPPPPVNRKIPPRWIFIFGKFPMMESGRKRVERKRWTYFLASNFQATNEA